MPWVPCMIVNVHRANVLFSTTLCKQCKTPRLKNRAEAASFSHLIASLNSDEIEFSEFLRNSLEVTLPSGKVMPSEEVWSCIFEECVFWRW